MHYQRVYDSHKLKLRTEYILHLLLHYEGFTSGTSNHRQSKHIPCTEISFFMLNLWNGEITERAREGGRKRQSGRNRERKHWDETVKNYERVRGRKSWWARVRREEREEKESEIERQRHRERAMKIEKGVSTREREFSFRNWDIKGFYDYYRRKESELNQCRRNISKAKLIIPMRLLK